MAETPAQSNKLNWFVKFFDILFAGIALLSTVTIVISSLFPRAFSQSELLSIVIYFLPFILALIFATFWHFQKTINTARSLKLHAWMLGILRYWLAYEVSVYGFAKILKTQFGIMYSRSDTVVGSLSGFELTWNYFGFSYTLAVIIGLLQIGGSVLLLFRRTTLLGICVLMPVMINIVLINVFYSIATGAFINSLLITGGLTYLLVLRWPQLKEFFLNTSDKIPPVRLSFVKPLLKIIIIAGAFFTIYQFVMNQKPVDFLGKWKVEKLERNGMLIDDNAWATNANAWKYIYIEQYGRMSMSPNPYIFDKGRATWAEYHYDAKKKVLQMIYTKQDMQPDTSLITITKTGNDAMEWNTTYYGETLKIKLTKAEPAIY